MNGTYCVVALASVFIAGCSSGAKSESTTSKTTNGQADNGGNNAEISGELLDELKRFFDRKRRVVTRCYSDALQAGQLNVDQAHVTIGLRVLPGGRADKVHVVNSSVTSAALTDCVINYVKSWTYIEVPKALDYSYRFGFEKL